MFSGFNNYILVFLTGLAVTYLLTPVVRTWAIRLGAVDLPNERRPHLRPTARGGGLAVVLGVYAASLVALALPWARLGAGSDLRWWGYLGLGSLILVVVGVIDDFRRLRPLWKLGGQVLAAGVVSLSGARFGTVFGYQLPVALDCLLAVFWIVGIINAFNLIDGLDGLASGLAMISAAGLCGIMVLGHLPGNVIVLVGLIGACLGFLRYNFHPATIFLGDTGSMFLGFVLGIVSLQTLTKSTFVLSLGIPLLVLGVPIFDEILAIWRRSVRLWIYGQRPGGEAKPGGIMQADVEHLHHRLLKAGLSPKRVVTTLYGLNVGLVVFGLLITTFQSHAAGIFLLGFLALVYVVMRQMAAIELRDTGTAILNGLRRPTHDTLKSLAYPVWDMACLAAAVAIAMWVTGEPRAGFWHAWFLELPLWITPTFSMLAASRTHVTVWTRARPLDVLALVSKLLLGLVFSLGIALLMDPGATSTLFVRAFVVGAIGHPAILCARVFYRCTEEFVLYMRNKSAAKPGSERILLYGAGGRCQLFLKERGFVNSGSYDGRIIAGLLDDEPSLRSQWVYGYEVLGGLKDLPQIIARHKVGGIIITAKLHPESRAQVQKLAAQHAVPLSEWFFESRPVGVGAETDH